MVEGHFKEQLLDKLIVRLQMANEGGRLYRITPPLLSTKQYQGLVPSWCQLRQRARSWRCFSNFPGQGGRPLRRRRVLVVPVELEPVGQVPEIPNVVLENEDDLLHGRDALVRLASPVKVVDRSAKVLEKKCPISRLK